MLNSSRRKRRVCRISHASTVQSSPHMSTQGGCLVVINMSTPTDAHTQSPLSSYEAIVISLTLKSSDARAQQMAATDFHIKTPVDPCPHQPCGRTGDQKANNDLVLGPQSHHLRREAAPPTAPHRFCRPPYMQYPCCNSKWN